MGFALLLMVSAYLRPSEAVNRRTEDWRPPSRNVLTFYSLLSFRGRNLERSRHVGIGRLYTP